MEEQSADREAASAAAPAGQQALNNLAELLRVQDLQALDLLEQMKPGLIASIGTEATLSMVRSAEALDFQQALTLLEKAMRA